MAVQPSRNLDAELTMRMLPFARVYSFIGVCGENSSRVDRFSTRATSAATISRSDDTPLLIAGEPAVVVLRSGITRAQSYYRVLISGGIDFRAAAVRMYA